MSRHEGTPIMRYNADTKKGNLKLTVRAFIPLATTYLLIPATFLIPRFDATKAPYFDLTGPIPQIAFWLSRSSGMLGALIVIIPMLILFLTRTASDAAKRWNELGIILLLIGIFGGGMAALNEFLVKELVGKSRPNIVALAGEDGAGPLRMTPAEFYGSGRKSVRSEILRTVLDRTPRPVPMSSNIATHWIEATGHSFPSGHAFTAMFFAGFFLLLGSTYLGSNRLWFFYVSLPWALAVCYSRLVLRVHTPIDITVGGFAGLVFGILAWNAARHLISQAPATRIDNTEIRSE